MAFTGRQVHISKQFITKDAQKQAGFLGKYGAVPPDLFRQKLDGPWGGTRMQRSVLTVFKVLPPWTF